MQKETSTKQTHVYSLLLWFLNTYITQHIVTKKIRQQAYY